MVEVHLRVYSDRSELIHPDGRSEIFLEGGMSKEAQLRYQTIHEALARGFLEEHILGCREQAASLDISQLAADQVQLIDVLVGAVTSEVGRGLVGVLVMQLCIKVIEPGQNIRLHKGNRSAKRDFSWREGISMRTINSQYIIPQLRKYELLMVNKDGSMMTRTFAENYPYSPLYKANIRGARKQWLQIVEEIESGTMHAEQSLNYILSQLLNQATNFKELADDALAHLDAFLQRSQRDPKEIIIAIMTKHMGQSGYAARTLEIAMHTLMQAIDESGALEDMTLAPLSQMRSANKKHGNIGDIELLKEGEIIEAWDAKYGKPYLRDEIEELSDKLADHEHVAKVGFVTNGEPEGLAELATRIVEIEDEFGVSLEILSFNQWVDEQFDRAIMETGVTAESLAQQWIRAYTESIAQKRRHLAPIDEPCLNWLVSLDRLVQNEVLGTQ